MRPRIREVRGALCRRGVEHFIGKRLLNNGWSILPSLGAGDGQSITGPLKMAKFLRSDRLEAGDPGDEVGGGTSS
ncbi:hypothetical protein E2C01_032323 [Portunus trituberculatus]|uniref:Uncharacterized protein n=1 Tax=Portunus trituberculatus TaxID=210409 RepID=A0A5B7F003_PORTR|nr:hypothetical protein [Portunus trituberculatus]